MNRITHITQEQKEKWDKITGPGKYIVDGPIAYEYLCTMRIRNLILSGDHFCSIIVLGEKGDQVAFLKLMIAEGVTDDVQGEPEFIFGEERIAQRRSLANGCAVP